MTPVKTRFHLHALDPTQPEAIFSFEGYEWPDLEAASRSMIGKYGYKMPIELFGRVFVVASEDVRRLSQRGLPFTMGAASQHGFTALECNKNGPKSHVRWLDDEIIEKVVVDLTPRDGEISFAETFFEIERQVFHFTLGKNPTEIFTNLRFLDVDASDCVRLLEAANISNHYGKWIIGMFCEPVVVCGQLFPKQTVAVFQGENPGSRFALFSVADEPERWEQLKSFIGR